MVSSILDTLRLRTLQGEVSSRSPCRHRDLEFGFQVDIKPTGNDMVVPEICKVGRAPRTEPLGTRIRNGQRERNPPRRQLEQPQREGSERKPGQGDIKREGGASSGGRTGEYHRMERPKQSWGRDGGRGWRRESEGRMWVQSDSSFKMLICGGRELEKTLKGNIRSQKSLCFVFEDEKDLSVLKADGKEPDERE